MTRRARHRDDCQAVLLYGENTTKCSCPTRLHDETVPDRRGRLARLLDRIRHRHYVVRKTWTLDNSSWADDPNALYYCPCGARRRMWGGSWAP